MAINKYMRAALKALSYADIDYKLERNIKNLAGKNPMNDLRKDLKRTIKVKGKTPVPIAVYYPMTVISDEVILFFHGGGWVSGTVESYAKTCDILGEMTGRRVVAVDYALAPEYPFPYAVEECYGVARELILRNSLFDVKPSDVILAGDSAGGNIAAAVSLMARDRGEFSINRQILIYPAVNNDHTENSQFESVRTNGTDYLLTSKRLCEYLDMYASDPLDKYNPYFAPYIAKDLSDQPDTLIITAEFDPLRDEGEAYGEKLKEFGNYAEVHRIHDALHGFFSLPFRYPHVRQAYKIINEFLKNTEKGAADER
ncbi:MAG: alpha/beta hydrolase [Clostridia bacterium]|nr:alpha/beta hydrolase [Clostridia bacterium]